MIWLDLTRQSVREENATETELWVSAQGPPGVFSHVLSTFTLIHGPNLPGSYCYAQVAKSPNDHQGADIRCKSKRVFITKLELGLPPLPTQRL